MGALYEFLDISRLWTGEELIKFWK